ncbi:MAG: NAD(P)/FAD-dependent oxidoreductase [Jatrophihabitans sp.]|nr:MAG: NAD(P)/FAD-dependent oxidoreductase [Jatrophihabitans sp.]
MADFEVIVLGLGPGGEDVAGSLAAAGRSVLGVEPRLVGGECPYFGCIPSKMLLRGAQVLAEARRVDGMAGHADVTPAFTPVADRIRDEATDDWDDAVAVRRLEGKGMTFARGSGTIRGRDGDRIVVEVEGTTHRAQRVVVATGTAPVLPPVEGLAELYTGEPGGPVWTNREAVRAREVPGSLAVLGGGAIGCELAQGFARFGARVSVIEAAPRILMPEEPEAAAVIAQVFAREGIAVHQGVAVEEVTRADDGGVQLRLDTGRTVRADTVLVAAGRRTNLDIGLATLGLADRPRTLDVDERMRVLSPQGSSAGGAAGGAGEPVDGLYAIGDVTGRGAFTHVAIWQAKVLAAGLLGREQEFGGYRGLAWVTFTDPEVGHAGLTEQQARDAGIAVRTGTQQIASNSRGWIHGPGNDGVVKLVADADRDVLVGATVVAPNGGEILGLLTLAVHAQVPLRLLRSMHYAFPTMHRAVLEALADLG